jgi:hypothetical protein
METQFNVKENLLRVLANARQWQKLSADSASAKARISELNRARQTQKPFVVNVPAGASVVLIFG